MKTEERILTPFEKELCIEAIDSLLDKIRPVISDAKRCNCDLAASALRFKYDSLFRLKRFFLV